MTTSVLFGFELVIIRLKNSKNTPTLRLSLDLVNNARDGFIVFFGRAIDSCQG